MDKLQEVLNKIEPVDKKSMDLTQERLNNLTKPLGSLGRLEEMAKILVSITRKEKPSTEKKVIFTLAGDHGVVEEGVTAYPKEVTPQMVHNFINGGAGINVLSRQVGAKVVVVDIGVASDLKIKNAQFKSKKICYGTKNMAKGPAMSKQEVIESIETGIKLVEEEGGIDIIGTGDMGIGNTTASSAIISVITESPVEKVTGRGTGIDDKILKNKIAVIKKAIALNKPNHNDAIDVLSKVGGLEIGGLAGIMLAGARHKIPVIIDGFISGAAALIAVKLKKEVKDYLIAGHCSQEPGHIITLNWLGLKPLLNLNLRLGEGTGAALAMNIVESSVKILTEMATFSKAGVSEKT